MLSTAFEFELGKALDGAHQRQLRNMTLLHFVYLPHDEVSATDVADQISIGNTPSRS